MISQKTNGNIEVEVLRYVRFDVVWLCEGQVILACPCGIDTKIIRMDLCALGNAEVNAAYVIDGI